MHTKEHAAGMPQLLPPHAEAYIRDELGLAGASHPFSHCVRQLKRRGYAEGDIDQDDLGLLLYRDAWAQAKCAELKDELERSGS